MYRTHLFLLKYYLPLLLLVGIGLALWQVQVSWHVPVVLLPVVALGIMLVIGSLALAREGRTAPAAPERIPKERSSVLTGDPLVVVARTKEIEEEPTNAPPQPGPESLARALEDDPDLSRAFDHLRIALADTQIRPEVLRSLELFAQAAKIRK